MQRTTSFATTDRPAAEEVGFAIVHAEALRHFVPLVGELGGAADRLLAEARIDPGVLTQAGSALEYRGFVRLLELAAAQTGRPDFGMMLAERQRGGKVIGPVGVVMKNSRTIGQALGYCAKHVHAYSLGTKVRFRPDRAAHTLFIVLEILLDRVVDARQAVEHALSLANLNIADISAGKVCARRVCFRHEPSMPLARYRDHYGCTVLFSQAADGLLLTEDDLLCPIAEPDEQVFEMATSFIDQRFPVETPPIHSRVRGLILRHLGGGECNNEAIAAELCMHPRTLQRRLRSEGRSFESIKDDVRREVALMYLRQDDMPLTRVAEKLGYSETSVLSRSCHRWFDASPLQMRRRQAIQPVACVATR